METTARSGLGPPQPLVLPYRPPYDWAALHAYLTARLIPGIDVAGPGFYARTFALDGRAGTVVLRQAPGEDAFLAEIACPDPTAIPRVGARLRHLLNLDADPAAIHATLCADPFMAGLVARRPGLRVPGAWDGFELAVRAVLGQQVSVTAAIRLAGRLVARFGRRIGEGDGLDAAGRPGLTHLFPVPDALVEADIALALTMPRARGAAIRAVAAAVIAEPDLFAPGQGLAAAIARLTALRGIGDWTAQYIAMRALREPDAFPASDVGLLRALETAGVRPSPAALLARAEAWRPCRASAVVQLWAHDAERLARPETQP